jgi:hypothetical protein
VQANFNLGVFYWRGPTGLRRRGDPVQPGHRSDANGDEQAQSDQPRPPQHSSRCAGSSRCRPAACPKEGRSRCRPSTSPSSARDPPASPRPCTPPEHVRALSSSSAGSPVARSSRPTGSRTTRASPRGSVRTGTRRPHARAGRGVRRRGQAVHEHQSIRPEDLDFIVTTEDPRSIGPGRDHRHRRSAEEARRSRRSRVHGTRGLVVRDVRWRALQGQDRCVIGGGDAAVEEALFLTKFASKVYLSTAVMSCAPPNVSRSAASRTRRSRCSGAGWSQRSRATDRRSPGYGCLDSGPRGPLLPVDGVFIFVGVDPVNEVADLVELDDNGYIKIDHDGRTSWPGCTRPVTSPTRNSSRSSPLRPRVLRRRSRHCGT